MITTDHGGIEDIFRDGINGYYVEKKSKDSIKVVLEELLRTPRRLLPIALANHALANSKYTKATYISAFLNVFDSMGNV